MHRKALIICVDALGPDYLEAAAPPNMRRMAEEGSFVIGQSVIPSVTNVNNVSILTCAPPFVHGITSNYCLDRDTGQENYMESPAFLECPTLLQRAKQRGMSTALLTSKKKLLRLLNAGADDAVAAEDPDEESIRRAGPARDIYSADINVWLFRALRAVLKERDPDLVYCSTTDWMMHRYPPEAEESIRHLLDIDAILGRILEENPEREVYLTADHGMSAKTRGIDIEKVLAPHGIRARAVPIIKDRYVAHHQNLGGASYVYLDKQDQVQDALDALRSVPGVEECRDRDEAVERFELMGRRIGDIFVLGDKDTVFGEFEDREVAVNVRSHGSRHESAVPIIVYQGRTDASCQRNFDVARGLNLSV